MATWTNPMLGNVDGTGQKYGDSRSGGRVHVGYDIGTAGVAGRPVVAGSAGTVTVVDDRATATARGKYVLIAHEGGVRTLYQHLASTSVAVGQTVATGQQIGVCGDTGSVDFPIHLHLEVYTSGASNSTAAGETTDPKPFFLARGVTLGKTQPSYDPGNPTTPNPTPNPTQERTMRIIRAIDDPRVWSTDGVHAVHLTTQTMVNDFLRIAGQTGVEIVGGETAHRLVKLG